MRTPVHRPKSTTTSQVAAGDVVAPCEPDPRLSSRPLVPYGECTAAFTRHDRALFHGLTEHRHSDGPADQIEVIALGVESGRSQLSEWKRAFVDAVHSGRVRFEIGRASEDTSAMDHLQPTVRGG